MPDVPDMELVRQYADHHIDAAFATLVSRHVNLVYSTALRQTGNPAIAEEITQVVFIILAQKAGRISARTVLPGWLYQTTRLTAKSFWKREKRRTRREQEAYRQTQLNTSSSDEAWRRLGPLLEDAMGQLAEKERAAIVLRYFGGKSFAEVGRAFGVTENAAQKRVRHGLEKLCRYFSRRGVHSTTEIIEEAVSVNSVQTAPAVLAESVTVAALAKGAATSGSTLALLRGALKWIAWSQAKPVVVASASIILATIAGVTVTGHYRNDPGRQTGRLRLPTGDVTPSIAFSRSPCGTILASDGSLWSWGENGYGWPVLGLANTKIQNTVALRRIGKDTNWVSIATDYAHCLAIKSDGTLWAWGANFDYQLGDGTKIQRPTPVRSVPGNDWKAVAAGGGAASFAIKTDGTLWTWGRQDTDSLVNQRAVVDIQPVQVGTSTNWVKIWAGDMQTAGLQSDGSIWFWGSFTGDARDTNSVLVVPTRMSPDTNWVDACIGYFTVFAVKSDGTLWSWGNQADLYTLADDAASNAVPMRVGTDSDWKSCASSSGSVYHLVSKKDGSLWALDASEHRAIKPAPEYRPVSLRRIDLDKDIVAFAAGGDSIGVALTRDGEVWTWGHVIGEHPRKIARDSSGKPYFVVEKFRTVATPWQLTNIDSGE